MNKYITLIISILVIGLILFWSLTNLIKIERNLYIDVESSEVQAMSNEKSDFVVYFYQKSCVTCKKVKPIINQYIKDNNQDIYAVDINNDKNQSYIANNIDIQATPTVIFYKNGKETNRIVGDFNKKDLTKKLEYIKG